MDADIRRRIREVKDIDEVIRENQEELEESKESKESKQPKKKSRISFTKLAALLLATAALVLVLAEVLGITSNLETFFNPPMHFVETAYITHEVGAAAQIATSHSGFFLMTRDAVRFHNTDGTEIFRHGHTITNPITFSRGSHVAIMAQGGRVFHVYNTQNWMYSIATDNPIVRFALSAQGLVAVMTDRGNKVFDLAVHNDAGVVIHEGVVAGGNITPIAMDISPDGRVLAISYLDINDAQMNSFVSFFSLDGSHVGAEDAFAQSTQNPNQIIGHIRFLENGRLVAVSDTRVFILNATADTIWETELTNRFTHLAFSGNWFAIAYGDIMLNRDGYAPGTVVGYDADGVRVFQHTVDGGAVHNLQAMGDYIVIGGSGHFAGLSRRGDVVWEHTIGGNIGGVGLMGGANELVVTTPTQTSILRRVRQ
ncbi:MAG: DUF5711 family protein [Defluviitaleaceae bacterium]|nr:DUF5711 family protein [Defluviitaleaceae bacterium]